MYIKNRKAKIEIYIIPFVIITLMTYLTVIIMDKNIENYFYDLKKQESLKISRNISKNLSHTGSAVDNIFMLLNEKLINLLIMTDEYREFHSDEFLNQLASKYEIDEIYTYNQEGTIVHSSSGKYLGWETPVGHPIYNFMVGDEDILIEDIRKDSESDLFYKYGYIKSEDGSFIQIGILADRVHELLESVKLQAYLETMVVDSDIYQLSALDENFIISASTNQDLIGSRLNNEGIIRLVREGKMYDQVIEIEERNLFKITVPLDYVRENIVAFEIYYSLDSMQPVIKRNVLASTIGVAFVYISLIYAIYVTYKRNNKLVELAYFDKLTGLPNLESLKEKLIGLRVKNSDNKAILMIKCSNLNLINLTFGYEYGDRVLEELGKALKNIENDEIKLYKFTAEKFVLTISNYRNKEELLEIIRSINDLLTNPLIIDNKKAHVAIKIGAIEFKDSDKSTDVILKNATLALNYIGDSEEWNYKFFNEKMELEIQRSETIERELRESINNDDSSKVFLYYQPIIASTTNRIAGFEALARMNSEEYGFIPPLEFIDIAERNQLIIPLTNMILKEACSFVNKLIKSGFGDIYVAVNISTIHMLQENFVASILNILKEAGIEGRHLEIELTESIFMDDLDLINKKLKELRASGIRVSIDDFGTGYSSFDRLSELSIDTLKIDRYFINKISDTKRDYLITRDIISFAHSLGLKTVAEGVELDTQKDFLLEYDCDKLQGFLYSKPVPENEAIKILKEYNR